MYTREWQDRGESGAMMSLRDKAYYAIKNKILRCQYESNGFLNETALMEELQVSRTPIREALTRLEQEGLVTVLPKKGVMVRTLTINEINQSFEARMLLEPFIIRKDLKYLDLKKLHEIRDKSEELIESALDPEQFALLDDRFHRLLAQGCSNLYFRNMLAHIFDQHMRIRVLSGSDIWERHKEAAKEHQKIIDLIFMGERDKAGDAMLFHLKGSRETALRSLGK